jgi:hypothetical protein
MNGQNENGPSVAAPEPLDQLIRKSSEDSIIEQSQDCKAVLYDLSDNGSVVCRDAKPAPEEDPLGTHTPAEMEAIFREAEAEQFAAARACEPEPLPQPRILARRELTNPPRTTLLTLPTHGPFGSSQTHAILWADESLRDERVISSVLLPLWRRKLLPFHVLFVAMWHDGIALATDLACAENIAAYGRAVSKLQWALPFRVTVVACELADIEFAVRLGCGLPAPDEQSGGGL